MVLEIEHIFCVTLFVHLKFHVKVHVNEETGTNAIKMYSLNYYNIEAN